MKADKQDMPLRQVEDLRLTAEEKREASLEVRNAEKRSCPVLYCSEGNQMHGTS